MAPKAPALTREKETLILDAAQRRFAVYGPAKVTMDEIASDIGMGKASLYYYFPTKEHLFRSVIEREQMEFMVHLRGILGLDIPAAEKLKRYAEKRLDYFKTLLNLQFLNLNSFLSPMPMITDLFEAFAAEELKSLTEIIREGKRRGEFDVRSPEGIASLLLHILHGLRLRMLKATQFSSARESDSDGLARETRLAIEVFVRGITKTKTPLKAERA
jgi:TetR/AcrR family transcriptional regulator